MSQSEIIKRVRIYLSERDQAEGQPLYLAALERLRREGATGATALRGVAGFGAGQRLRTSAIGGMNEAPIIIEWVDRAERIARILPLLDELLREALITTEDLRVYRAVLRSSGPFGDRTVGQAMARQPATAQPGMLVRTAVELMLAHDQALLPVVDERGTLLGVCGAAELANRAELALPLRLLPALDEPERTALLGGLPLRSLADVMSADPRTIGVESSIAQALSPLIEWGIDLLPVLDHEGRLAGLLGAEQVLRAAVPESGRMAGAVRDAEPPTPASLVMQRAVPTVPATAPLAAVIEQLLGAPERFLVAIEDGRPRGIITDVGLTSKLAGAPRAAWLAALGLPQPELPALPEAAGEPGAAALLADASCPIVGTHTPQEQVIGLLLAGAHERLLVAEDDGRLAGVMSRRGLVRALAQASAAG